jgi:hypothetical protein
MRWRRVGFKGALGGEVNAYSTWQSLREIQLCQPREAASRYRLESTIAFNHAGERFETPFYQLE